MLNMISMLLIASTAHAASSSLCQTEVRRICSEANGTYAADDDVLLCLWGHKNELSNECSRWALKTREDIKVKGLELAEACESVLSKFCTPTNPGGDWKEPSGSANMSFEDVWGSPVKGAPSGPRPKGDPFGATRCLRMAGSGLPKPCQAKLAEWDSMRDRQYKEIGGVMQTHDPGEGIGLCHHDIEKLCRGEARPMKCLQENMGQLESLACRKFVKKKARKRAQSLPECKNDVMRFCADVQPGKRRVSECLLDHEDKLSVDCREGLLNLSKDREE